MLIRGRTTRCLSCKHSPMCFDEFCSTKGCLSLFTPCGCASCSWIEGFASEYSEIKGHCGLFCLVVNLVHALTIYVEQQPVLVIDAQRLFFNCNSAKHIHTCILIFTSTTKLKSALAQNLINIDENINTSPPKPYAT